MRGLFGAIAGRVAGALVGAAAGIAAAKGLGEISVSAQGELAIWIANAFMLAGYGIAHKVFDHAKK